MKKNNVYVIAFDLSVEALRLHYKFPHNAYPMIRRTLSRYGFTQLQDSVYVSQPEASQESADEALKALFALSWFRGAAKDLNLFHANEVDVLWLFGDEEEDEESA